MRKQLFTATAILLSAIALLVLLCLLGRTSPSVPRAALAAPDADPTVMEIDPCSAPNDLDIFIVITGTGFTAELSGTLVISSPTVHLGDTLLDDAGWVSTMTLTATVPWGLDPGVYTMTVVNADGITGTLPNAFTVTQGLDVWTTGGPYGGSIIHMVLHPITSTWVYAANLNALFFSADSAAHWQPMFLGNLGRPSFDAQMPQLIYYANAGGDATFRTQDGGITWEHIPPPNPFLHAFNLVAHPTASGVVYATAYPYDPSVSGGEGGIYRSENRGDSWVTITTGLTDTDVTAIAFHPEDPETMLAATQNGNVFTTTNAGASWNWVTHLHASVERLYFSPFEGHEAWAILGSPFSTVAPPYDGYKSLDSDLGTWFPVTITGDCAVLSLAFHPTVSGTMFAGACQGYASTDGGQTWSALVSSPPEVIEFVIDPAAPNVMYAGTRHQGVFKSTDGGATWAEANQGLAGVVPSYLAVSPADPHEVYASAPESLGMLKSGNGGGSWRSLGIERGGYPWPGNPLAVDPSVPRQVYLGDIGCPDSQPDCDLFAEGVPRIRISEDGGQTWHVVTLSVPSALSGWVGETFAVAPHPNIPGRLLAGITLFPLDFAGYVQRPRGGIYVSDDYGEHWTQIELSRPISGVSELVYAPADPQVVYASTGGTGLLRSDDGGQHWQIITSSVWSESQDVMAVAIHPKDPDTVYVSESGDPYVSFDAGASWMWLDLGLSPELSLYVANLLFAPIEPAMVYVGGTGGAYRSRDGQTWESVPGVPQRANVGSLATGRDEGRVVVYVGTTGGVVPVEEQVAGASDVIPGLGGLMGGGVYRATTRVPNQRVYLPLALKEYTR